MILLLTLVNAHSAILTWIPGLLLFGTGVGVMLTSSVNVVQSASPDTDQGEISGLSRSVSNIGSATEGVGGTVAALRECGWVRGLLLPPASKNRQCMTNSIHES
jgi:hypothetical protein